MIDETFLEQSKKTASQIAAVRSVASAINDVLSFMFAGIDGSRSEILGQKTEAIIDLFDNVGFTKRETFVAIAIVLQSLCEALTSDG